jgi:hypothetical protein
MMFAWLSANTLYTGLQKKLCCQMQTVIADACLRPFEPFSSLTCLFTQDIRSTKIRLG